MEVNLETLERAKAATGDTPFWKRLRDLLKERGISNHRMIAETGIAARILYPPKGRKEYRPNKSTLMAFAYYFGITGEELVEGTDAANAWYRAWED